jgi:para-aminobenzoate synthetase/4-amino-4-deoxychorismate lyase
MRLINQLEPSPRGIYCGALGIVERSGSVFNVPIRTIWLDRKTRRAEYGTGGGITADSAAESEFDELLTKTAVVTEVWPDFQLLETMRAHAGAVLRLDRHLQRLEESADYFGFEFCPETIARALREQLVHAPNDARVRLLLSEEGLVQVECAALDSLPANPTVAWARTPVQSGNRFLFHKTTHRAVYDAHARAAASSFDVLLFNERDEVTEFTRGNVVVELAGKLLTPARESGLLAGVFRNELLAAGVVAEAVVPKSAIAHAARMWFVNSVREWVEVRLV